MLKTMPFAPVSDIKPNRKSVRKSYGQPLNKRTLPDTLSFMAKTKKSTAEKLLTSNATALFLYLASIAGGFAYVNLKQPSSPNYPISQPTLSPSPASIVATPPSMTPAMPQYDMFEVAKTIEIPQINGAEDPDVREILGLIAQQQYAPENVAMVKDFGANVIYPSGMAALEEIAKNGTKVTFSAFPQEVKDAGFVAYRDQQSGDINLNIENKGNPDKALKLATASLAIHEMCHDYGKGDRINSLQEEIDCSGMLVLSHRYFSQQDPSIFNKDLSALPTNVGDVLLYDKLYSKALPEDGYNEFVGLMANTYGNWYNESPNHPNPAGENKFLNDINAYIEADPELKQKREYFQQFFEQAMQLSPNSANPSDANSVLSPNRDNATNRTPFPAPNSQNPLEPNSRQQAPSQERFPQRPSS